MNTPTDHLTELAKIREERKKTKAFEEWIRANADWITQSEKDLAGRVWNARQPEIDSLKAEVARLNSALMRDAISDIQNVERVEVFPVYIKDDIKDEKLRKAPNYDFYRGALVCLQHIYSSDQETIFRETVKDLGVDELLKVALEEDALDWSGLRKYGYCE